MLLDTLQAGRTVAERLGSLIDDEVFLRGATLPSLITEAGAPPPRPTTDVDIIVEILTTREYQGSLRSKLLNFGFREQLCDDVQGRWTVDAGKVDVMPAQAAVSFD